MSLASRPALRWFLLNAAFWAVIATLSAMSVLVRTQGSSFLLSWTAALVSFSPCVLLSPVVRYIALRFRFADNWQRALTAHLPGLAAFLVIGGAMMGGLGWLMPWQDPSQDLLSAVRLSIIRYLAPDAMIYVLSVAAVQVAAYAQEARARTVMEAQLRAQIAEAELHALSAKLHPHFLFNTLNAISALVREEPQQAERLLARLSDLLRHALNGGQSTESTLSDELTFLEKYLDIQEARIGPRLSVAFEIDSQLLDIRVPRLLLQPLVENAIRHGIGRQTTDAQVLIAARRLDSRVQVSVSDNGIGLPAPALRREGIGLTSTRARLQQFYGTGFGFSLENRPDGGALCLLDLPILPAQ